jgi:hypothetical protein
MLAFREPEGHHGREHHEKLEDTGQDQRHAPACRLLHIEPAIQREGGPRAEDGAAGYAEGERHVLFTEPDDHCGGPDGNEHRPADPADHSEEG